MMAVPEIATRLKADGIETRQLDDFDEIAGLVASEAGDGDVVVVMSSGAFGGVHEKILERLRS
jgi:UDP-N-acetylmuramate: L-alanyl-gamma-D-glutamyl-meso-diaminopimelate ligase